MHIEINRQIKSPIIIVGFPGVGLIGPIVTEFLIEHMKTEQVGSFVYDDLAPMVPIHKGKMVHPMSVHYSAQHNTLIIYTILNLQKGEWPVARAIAQLAKDVGAKEVLCIDGATAIGEENQIYSFGDPKLADHGAKLMEESVIMGVTGALMLSASNVSCIFASAHVELPDSKAAAQIVKFLDKHLNLGVDYQPLLEQAEKFEEKLRTVMSNSQRIIDEKERKNMDYLG
jgi:uncharacterized protein